MPNQIQFHIGVRIRISEVCSMDVRLTTQKTNRALQADLKSTRLYSMVMSRRVQWFYRKKRYEDWKFFVRLKKSKGNYWSSEKFAWISTPRHKAKAIQSCSFFFSDNKKKKKKKRASLSCLWQYQKILLMGKCQWSPKPFAQSGTFYDQWVKGDTALLYHYSILSLFVCQIA